MRENNVITDRLLSSWIHCKRKAWLDIYEKKERLSFLQEKLIFPHFITFLAMYKFNKGC